MILEGVVPNAFSLTELQNNRRLFLICRMHPTNRELQGFFRVTREHSESDSPCFTPGEGMSRRASGPKSAEAVQINLGFIFTLSPSMARLARSLGSGAFSRYETESEETFQAHELLFGFLLLKRKLDQVKIQSCLASQFRGCSPTSGTHGKRK
jgi:hypothetical protein